MNDEPKEHKHEFDITPDSIFRTVKLCRELRVLIPKTPDTAVERHDLRVISEFLNGMLTGGEKHMSGHRGDLNTRIQKYTIIQEFQKEE